MSNLRTLRNLFSCQEQLSLNQLQKIRGGAGFIQTGNNPSNNQNGGNNSQGNNQNFATAALDDNKRPERPGGGVSTH
jgi:hypothetical protein